MNLNVQEIKTECIFLSCCQKSLSQNYCLISVIFSICVSRNSCQLYILWISSVLPPAPWYINLCFQVCLEIAGMQILRIFLQFRVNKVVYILQFFTPMLLFVKIFLEMRTPCSFFANFGHENT